MNKLRIRLKSYDHRVLDQSIKAIIDTAKRFGINIAGPIPLPTERSLYTVLRSPHVDKKSREQFEIRVHKRLVELNDVTPDIIDALNKLEIPAGVYVEVKAI
jgi:small subunit ribosomal protein S10